MITQLAPFVSYLTPQSALYRTTSNLLSKGEEAHRHIYILCIMGPTAIKYPAWNVIPEDLSTSGFPGPAEMHFSDSPWTSGGVAACSCSCPPPPPCWKLLAISQRGPGMAIQPQRFLLGNSHREKRHNVVLFFSLFFFSFSFFFSEDGCLECCFEAFDGIKLLGHTYTSTAPYSHILNAAPRESRKRRCLLGGGGFVMLVLNGVSQEQDNGAEASSAFSPTSFFHHDLAVHPIFLSS